MEGSVDPEQLVKGTNEEDGSEHVYAVDILGSTMSEELPVLKKDMFAGFVKARNAMQTPSSSLSNIWSRPNNHRVWPIPDV